MWCRVVRNLDLEITNEGDLAVAQDSPNLSKLAGETDQRNPASPTHTGPSDFHRFRLVALDNVSFNYQDGDSPSNPNFVVDSFPAYGIERDTLEAFLQEQYDMPILVKVRRQMD
jgi:hypothetical protein